MEVRCLLTDNFGVYYIKYGPKFAVQIKKTWCESQSSVRYHGHDHEQSGGKTSTAFLCIIKIKLCFLFIYVCAFLSPSVSCSSLTAFTCRLPVVFRSGFPSCCRLLLLCIRMRSDCIVMLHRLQNTHFHLWLCFCGQRRERLTRGEWRGFSSGFTPQKKDPDKKIKKKELKIQHCLRESHISSLIHPEHMDEPIAHSAQDQSTHSTNSLLLLTFSVTA